MSYSISLVQYHWDNANNHVQKHRIITPVAYNARYRQGSRSSLEGCMMLPWCVVADNDIFATSVSHLDSDPVAWNEPRRNIYLITATTNQLDPCCGTVHCHHIIANCHILEAPKPSSHAYFQY